SVVCFLYITCQPFSYIFFFHHPPPTQIYTLSLHDALPISITQSLNHSIVKSLTLLSRRALLRLKIPGNEPCALVEAEIRAHGSRSEEHTSELQSRENLVCRLLLEKKNKKKKNNNNRQTTNK